MEKGLNCPSSLYGIEMMEFSPKQLTNCYFNSNWDTPNDQNDPFESALSSMVSSPTAASNGGGLIPGDGMMRELIGRLGSICDSTEVSLQSCIATANNSTNTSCYSTPLNSPPKSSLSPLMVMGANGNLLNYPPTLASFNADPGFIERAAKFSCFGNANFGGGEMGINNKYGKLSRVSSGGKSRGSTPENGEMGDSKEGSSVSEMNPSGEMRKKVQTDVNYRKRKSIPKAIVKEFTSTAVKDDKAEAENVESNAKRTKSEDEEGKTGNAEENAGESNSNNKNKRNNNKQKQKPEPPKDYIHVRARRGQATDSHSLAERVRREKISERMKFLQDLVPGCNKVTGKATVLDEIINYVQSLQHQVEFLSMKLATVTPRTEFSLETLLSTKDVFQPRGSAVQQTMYPFEQISAQEFPVGYQSSPQFPPSLPNGLPNHFSLNPLNAPGIRRDLGIQLPSINGSGESMNQAPTFWENDLHSIVQMGIAQNKTQTVPGTISNAQMKAEL